MLDLFPSTQCCVDVYFPYVLMLDNVVTRGKAIFFYDVTKYLNLVDKTPAF